MSSLKLILDTSTNQYNSSGTRTSNPIQLNNADGNYVLYWESYTPTNTSITIETSISYDNGTTWSGWSVATKNQSIPNLNQTLDLSTALIKIKQTLSTTDTNITPELYTMQLTINEGVEVNARESWIDKDTQILAKFEDSLDAGNINNNGIRVIGFQIKRREKNKLDTTYTLGNVYYEDGDAENKQFEFIDYTQPNKKLVYSILPIGENGLVGSASEIDFESDFTGWWIVDKFTNQVLGFDKIIGSMGEMDTAFAQDRTVIETFSKYSQIYYNSKEGHSFTLTSTFLPDEDERSGEVYDNLLNNFIRQHKPFLVKNSSGKLFVCDISNPKVTAPHNSWKDFDYITVSVDALEIMSIEDYMSETE